VSSPPPPPPPPKMSQQDLQREIDRAATLEEADGNVEVDVMGEGDDGGCLWVVTGALERVEAPALDLVDLELGRWCQVDGAHVSLACMGAVSG
jgi:hypothetical protein